MEDTDAPRILDSDDVKVFIKTGENLTEQKEITSSGTEPVPPESRRCSSRPLCCPRDIKVEQCHSPVCRVEHGNDTVGSIGKPMQAVDKLTECGMFKQKREHRS